MQSQSIELGGEGDTEDRTARLLSQHEYRLWKARRINDEYVQMWAKALTELQAEANCDYFVWLMQQNPLLQ